MFRALHLACTDADYQSCRTSQALTKHLANEVAFTRWTVGRGGTFPNPVAAFRAMRGRFHRDFDLVHAFDFTSLRTALAAGVSQIIYTSSGGSSEPFDALPWRWLIRGRRVRVIRDHFAERNGRQKQSRPGTADVVIPPAVDRPAERVLRDPGLRDALGCAKDDRILFLPGESTRAADHRLAVWAGSILHVLDPRYRILIWGRGDQVDSMRRLAMAQRQPRMLVVAESALRRRVEMEELFPAADVALVTPRSPIPLLPVAACLSAAIPTLATPAPCLGEVIVPNLTALVTARHSARLVAQQAHLLCQDPALQAQLAAAAMQRSREHFSIDGWAQEFRRVYTSLAAGR